MEWFPLSSRQPLAGYSWFSITGTVTGTSSSWTAINSAGIVSRGSDYLFSGNTGNSPFTVVYNSATSWGPQVTYTGKYYVRVTAAVFASVLGAAREDMQFGLGVNGTYTTGQFYAPFTALASTTDTRHFECFGIADLNAGDILTLGSLFDESTDGISVDEVGVVIMKLE